MLKRSLAFSCVLLFLGFNAFCDVWYSEDFDNFKDGDIAGQDEWKTAMNQKTCQIGSEVKRGDTGKSILVTENTMSPEASTVLTMEFSTFHYSRSGKRAQAQCCFISVEMPSNGAGLPCLISRRMALSMHSMAMQDRR